MAETNYQETTDHDEIRDWAEERNVVPAHEEKSGNIIFASREGMADESANELSWDEFNNEFDRQNSTFRYEPETSRYEFIESESSSEGEHTEDTTSTDINGDVDVDLGGGDALNEGDSARGEVTETRTVETEVVETATVETEVVDEEIISEEVVDTELLEQELTGCSLDERGEFIEADLRERKRLTTEVHERNLIESRVTDAEIEEANTTGTDTTSRDIDTEGDHDLIDDDTVEREVEEASIKADSQVDADVDVADAETEHDERIERRLIETEVIEQYHVRAEIESRDLFKDEVVSEEVTSTELLGDQNGSSRNEDLLDSEDDASRDEGILEDDDSSRERIGEAVPLTQNDEGKDVIDADGETIGMVSEVGDGIVYIDPNPGFTERLLGTSGADEDDITIREEQIEANEDDGLRLSRDGQDELESSQH